MKTLTLILLVGLASAKEKPLKCCVSGNWENQKYAETSVAKACTKLDGVDGGCDACAIVYRPGTKDDIIQACVRYVRHVVDSLYAVKLSRKHHF